MIGGQCVARGYLNAPDMTAERFLADPFREGKGGRVYRTGDRCRFLPDGQIAFMGRIDDQIKVMGHRIEPQEVMAALERHPAVQSSFVCAFPDSAGDQRLLAYIVSRNGTTPKPAELRNFLGSHLPLHMLPSAFVQVTQFPIGAQGNLIGQHFPSRLLRTSFEMIHPKRLSRSLKSTLRWFCHVF